MTAGEGGGSRRRSRRVVRTAVAWCALLVATTAAQAPPNDDCANAAPLSAGGLAGDLTGAAPTAALNSVCFAVGLADVWYTYTAAVEETLSVASSTVSVEIFTGPCSNPTLVGCFGQPLALAAGVPHYVRIFTTWPEYVGPFVVTVSIAAIPGDTCASAVPAVLGLNAGTFAGAAPTPSAPCPQAPGGGFAVDVWYSFTPASDGVLEAVSAGPSPSLGGIAIYEGGCAAPVLRACRVAQCAVPVSAGDPLLIRAIRGVTTSDAYAFTLELVPHPANDDCADATTTSLGTTIGTLSGASAEASTPVFCAWNDGLVDVWYRFVPAATAPHVVEADTAVYQWTVLSDDCPTPTPVACGPTLASPQGTSGIVFLTAGSPVSIRVTGGYPFTPTTFALTLTQLTPPPNDQPANAVPIAVGTTTVVMSGADAGLPLQCGGNPPGGISWPDVWFTFTAPAAGVLSMPFVTVGVYAPGVAPGTPVACSAGFISFLLPMAAGDTVLLQILSPEPSRVVRLEFEAAPLNDACSAPWTVFEGTNPMLPQAADGLFFTTADASPSVGFETLGPRNVFAPFIPGDCLAASGSDVFFRFTAPTAGHYTATLCRPPGFEILGASGGPPERRLRLDVFGVNPCGGATPAICHVDTYACPFVQFPLSAGAEAILRVVDVAPGLGAGNRNRFYLTILRGGVVVDPADAGCGGPALLPAPALYGTPPLLGAFMFLGVAGFDPGASGVVFASFPPAAPLELGGGCRLYLDLPSTVALGSFTANALGRAGLSGAVPTDPGIAAGATGLVFQAATLDFAGLALSNALRVEFIALP